MTDAQLIKTIQKAVKDEIRPLKDQVEIVKSKISTLDLFQKVTTNNISTIKEQQSVMNEKLGSLQEDLAEVKEIVEERLYPSVMEIELNIKAYGDMYKINNDNSKKLDYRLKVVEEKSGIKPDPEFSLAEVA